MIGKVICVHKNLTFSAIVEFIFVNDIFTILLYNAYLLLNKLYKHFLLLWKNFIHIKKKTLQEKDKAGKQNTTQQYNVFLA